MAFELQPAPADFLRDLKSHRHVNVTTADTFLREFELCLDGACPSNILKGVSERRWRSLMKRASRTVVYHGEGIRLEGIHTVKEGSLPTGLVLPPKTAAWVNTVVTTPTQDRDGDILETLGAHLFPRASHLFNHLPTENVGRLLKETAHTKELLSALLSLMQTQFAENVATMYEHGSLQTSHGFLPKKWEPLKSGDGFHVIEYDILEISGVSVPSNPDAGPIEFSRNKLTHPLLKEWGRMKFRERKPIAAVGIDLRALPPGTTITVPGEKTACGCNKSAKSNHDGHGIFLCKCGNVIRQCRCMEKHEPVTVDELCDECKRANVAQSKEAPRLIKSGPESPERNPLRWNKSLSKDFDVAGETLEPATLLYDWASKFLGVPVKKIFFTNAFIPSAKMGSFLSAWDVTTADYRMQDVRNIAYDGSELPPVYEVVQLNSKQSSDFLVDGTCFMAGDTKMMADFSPSWGGLSLKLYFAMDDREEAMALVPRTWEVAKAQFNFLKGESFSLSGEFLPETSETWDDLFLSPKNQKSLSRTVKLINDKQEKFANRGVVLLGPPGTGKTLSGRIIRNEANATFIWLSSRDFHYAGAFGSLTYAFDLAKELAPSILFIEDVDNWMRDTTIDLLKTEMDGIGRSAGILTILTTNYPERFPDALLDRPGRFHDVLKLDLPDKTARAQMLAKWVGDIADEARTKLLDATEGWSGAHMYELAQFAKVLQEQDELTLSDSLTKAIDKITEQRDLISEALLGGSHFRPRKELIRSLQLKGFAMMLNIKAMSKEGVECLSKAMGHLEKAMDHDDATAGTSFHAKRAHAHVKAVHEAHASGEPDEEKAEVTSEHVERLKKAAGYCKKGMDHKEATEPVANHFKAAHEQITKALDGMQEKDAADGDPTPEEQGEASATPVNKAGRVMNAANEKKLNKAKAHLKAIADDDEAHADVRKSASDGAESIDSIFVLGEGGDAGQDYDADGNYVGTDVGAYIDGEPNKNGEPGQKAGRAISKRSAGLITKAIGHAQAIIDHEHADEEHKGLAMAARGKLKSVMGEDPAKPDGDGPAMGTDPSTPEPGQGAPEKSFGDRISELADEARFTLAEGDETKLFDLIEAAGAIASLANCVKEAQLDIDLSLAESQLDRELDAAEAV